MENFWDYSVWSSLNIIAILLLSLLAGNMIKKAVPFLRVSLIPTAVIGGCIILVLEGVYKLLTGNVMLMPLFLEEMEQPRPEFPCHCVWFSHDVVGNFSAEKTGTNHDHSGCVLYCYERHSVSRTNF